MTGTKNRADAVRAHLDATQPGWQDQVRKDLDALTPGWESFPLLVWDPDCAEWIEIVLLANREVITAPAPGFWARLRQRFGLG